MNRHNQEMEDVEITAQPKSDERSEVETAFETGKASPESARASGYMNSKGEAVEMTKSDRPGNPTGAYTDIGAGRSSAVKHKTTEQAAPKVGEERAP